MVTNPELLEARYGRAKSKTRDRKLALVLASVLGVALLVWIFAVVFLAPAKAEGTVTGFQAQGDNLATVKGFVTKPADQSAICGVAARNGNLSIVGYVEFTADQNASTVPFELTFRTTELAGSGVVTECRLK